MPIPFRDVREGSGTALAGFLRYVPEPRDQGMRAALFVVDGRAEPVDFVFSRVDLPAAFLWRTGDRYRHAIASLTASLFTACTTTPALLVALADEVQPQLFAEDLLVEVPLCRVAEARADTDTPAMTGGGVADIYWCGAVPEENSPARTLLDTMGLRQSILEPFERAGRALEEAFATP